MYFKKDKSFTFMRIQYPKENIKSRLQESVGRCVTEREFGEEMVKNFIVNLW